MPDDMYLIVTLRRKVPDKATAKNIVELLQTKLSDHPEITISAHTSDHFDIPEGP